MQYFTSRAGQSPSFRPVIEGRMNDLVCSEGLYGRFENTRRLPSYHADSIKSEHGTSSHSMNSITTFSSQRRGNYESSDACVNDNTFDYAQPTQFLHYSAPGPQPFSHQTAQSLPSSQTSGLSTWNQVPQLTYPSTAKPSQPQVLYIEETARLLGEAPFYVKAKQFERILKRRVARQRLGCAPGSRRPYLHESRRRHAMRRPRGPGGRFLNKDELERQRRKVQKCLTDRAQTLETRTGPNTDRTDVERTDSLAALPKDHWGKRREVVRNGSQDNETDKLEARQSLIPIANLTFSSGGEIALEIESRKRTVMVTDCYAVHGDIQPVVDCFQFTNMFPHLAGRSNEG